MENLHSPIYLNFQSTPIYSNLLQSTPISNLLQSTPIYSNLKSTSIPNLPQSPIYFNLQSTPICSYLLHSRIYFNLKSTSIFPITSYNISPHSNNFKISNLPNNLSKFYIKIKIYINLANNLSRPLTILLPTCRIPSPKRLEQINISIQIMIMILNLLTTSISPTISHSISPNFLYFQAIQFPTRLVGILAK